MKSCIHKVTKIFLSIITLLYCSGLVFCFEQQAHCASSFQIDGFYLGATPKEVNIKVETDPLMDGKFYEVESKDVRLFFVTVKGTLRLYRIVKTQAINPNKIKSALDNLKRKYGTPDKQQIKTSSTRPPNRSNYITTVKNRAIWNISETQEFIAEIESKQIVYELLDSDPENIKSSLKPGVSEEGELGAEGWDPDY